MSIKRKIPLDLGFGSKITQAGDRLIHQDGSFNIIRKGNISWDTYQILMNLSFRGLFFVTLLACVVLNAIFALIFTWIGVQELSGVPKGTFFNDFFYAFCLSAQTFTTVGYGAIYPEGVLANIVASLCALTGLILFAIVTGLFFARFAQPRSHISFSKIGIFTPIRDQMSFQCRIVNKRNHRISNLKAKMVITWVTERFGTKVRQFEPLELELSEIKMFPVNWTLVHIMDESSPIHGKRLADLTKLSAEIIVMITGFDESYHQQIHDNFSYVCSEIRENVRFKTMYATSDEEPTTIFLDDLDKVVELKKK